MNKKHESVESLLQTGTHTGLSTSERSEMWGALKAYAEFHPGQVPSRSAVSSISTTFFKWGATAAAVLVVSVGTGVASTDSLPGEPLYAVKVDVVEPIIGLSHTNETKRLDYHATLMDRRLVEMHALAESNKLTEETLVQLEEKVEDHGTDITELLSSDVDQSITATEKLAALSDVVTTLRTHEYIEDTHVSRTRVSKFEKTEHTISTTLEHEIDEFAREEPQEAIDYIETVLGNIDTKIPPAHASSSAASLELQDYLEDVTDALQNGNVGQALQFTEEAEQTVELNENIEHINSENEPPEALRKKESIQDDLEKP